METKRIMAKATANFKGFERVRVAIGILLSGKYDFNIDVGQMVVQVLGNKGMRDAIKMANDVDKLMGKRND